MRVRVRIEILYSYLMILLESFNVTLIVIIKTNPRVHIVDMYPRRETMGDTNAGEEA